MAVAVAVALDVRGGGAVPVAVPVAGLTKRSFNHIQKDFLINICGLDAFSTLCFRTTTNFFNQNFFDVNNV